MVLRFMLKENVTNFAVGDGLTLGEPFRSVMLPPLPVPNDWFFKFLSTKISRKTMELYQNTGGFDIIKSQ